MYLTYPFVHRMGDPTATYRAPCTTSEFRGNIGVTGGSSHTKLPLMLPNHPHSVASLTLGLSCKTQSCSDWASKTEVIVSTVLRYTVRTIDLILRPIERTLQMQFSMARKFPLQPLRLYRVNLSKMCESARHLA